MRRLLVTVLAAASLASAQEGPTDAAFRSLREGIDLYHQRKFDDAIARFARARQLAPADWQAHAWQAFSLLQLAYTEQDPARRDALSREAESMTAPLVKECGIPFQHPLRLYIVGMAASVRKDQVRTISHLARAYQAPAASYRGFESIRLRPLVVRAYAQAAVIHSKRFILLGKFERADAVLKEAEAAMPADYEEGLRDMLRTRVVVSEGLSHHDAAIRGLRKCIEVFEDEQLKLEFRATIAQIYFKTEQYEKGVAELAQVPADSEHPDVLAARCTMHLHPALRSSPTAPEVGKAIAFYKSAIAKTPADNRYRLVEDFTKLVLHKVGPREAKAERALLLETLELVRTEIERRPECPELYFFSYKIYKLLGDTENEVKYQNLHKVRKAAYEGKEIYDGRGRPRCG